MVRKKLTSNQVEVRTRIGKFIELNPNMKRVDVVNHFDLEVIHRVTVYQIIRRLKSGQGVDRKPGSGLYRAIPQRIKDRIIEFAVNEVGLSYSFIAKVYIKGCIPRLNFMSKQHSDGSFVFWPDLASAHYSK